MGMINIGAGLSALGSSVADTAGHMAIEQQKSNLETQKLQLADQLAGARAWSAPGVAESVAVGKIGLEQKQAQAVAFQKLMGEGGPGAPASSSGASAANTQPTTATSDATSSSSAPSTSSEGSQSSAVQAPGLPQGFDVIPATVKTQMFNANALGGPAAGLKVYSDWVEQQNKVFDQREGSRLTTGAGVPIGSPNPKTTSTVPAGYELDPTTGGLRPRAGGPGDPKVIAANAKGRTTAEIQAKQDAISPNDPAVESYADQIYSGGLANASAVPPEYRTHVVNFMDAQAKQAEAEMKDPKIPPVAMARLSRVANNISSGYTSTSQYKLAVDGLPYIERIKAAMNQPHSAIGDAELLDSLTKLNTGGNAITDAQVKLVTDYKSYSDMLSTFKNKLAEKGGALSDSQRLDIEKLADATYDNYQRGYQPLYNELTGKLRGARIPESLWPIPDFDKLATKIRASLEAPGKPPEGAPTKFIEGQTYRDSKTGALATYRNGQFVEHP